MTKMLQIFDNEEQLKRYINQMESEKKTFRTLYNTKKEYEYYNYIQNDVTYLIIMINYIEMSKECESCRVHNDEPDCKNCKRLKECWKEANND